MTLGRPFGIPDQEIDIEVLFYSPNSWKSLH
jgi:hypothetical protein